MKKEANQFYIDNMDVLIEALKRGTSRLLALGVYQPGAGGKKVVSPGSLVAAHPHFHQLGVSAAFDGAPVMRDAAGRMLEPDETLDHLFGRISGEPACVMLFLGYGEGPLDDVLIARCGGAPSPRQLALARLYLARATLSGVAAPDVLGKPTAALVDVLAEGATVA